MAKQRTPRGGTLAQMQATLASQEAAAEATKQAMDSVFVAMKAILDDLDTIVNPIVSPRLRRLGGGSGGGLVGGGGGYGAGGRPTMGDNQTQRPVHGQGFGGIRAAVARGVHDRYGLGGGSTYTKEYDAQGNEKGVWERTAEGGRLFHQPGVIDDATIAAGAHRGAVTGIANRFGAMGALGAMRAIPYVGAAVMGAEAVKEGLTFVSNQRAANAPYQAIYGGSNFEQYGQRWDKFGFQLGNLFGGGLTWGQSDEAFKGVSALGYQGDRRNQDLGFVTSVYKQMGVSVSDSLALIKTAASDLNESLTGLQSGLKSTRDAAISTGQSGVIGQQILASNLQLLGQRFPSTSGGVTNLAGVLSTLQAGTGRDMSGISLAPMLTDPNILQMLGPNIGTDYTGMVGLIQSGSPRVLSAVRTQLTRGLSGTLHNQAVTNYIRQKVGQLGGANQLDANAMNIISTELMTNASRLGLNVQANTAAVSGMTRLPVNDDQALRMLIMKETGTGYFNTTESSRANYGLEAPSVAGESGLHQATFGWFGSDAHVINPVIDAARSNDQISGSAIIVNENGHRRIMSFNQALKEAPASIAKGTAIVASTGQTVREMLGGEHQKYYLNPNVDLHASPAQMSPAERHNARVFQHLRRDKLTGDPLHDAFAGIKDPAKRKSLSDAAWTASALASVHMGPSFSVNSVLDRLGGHATPDEYKAIQRYVSASHPKTESSSSGKGKAAGHVTITLSEEARRMFSTIPSSRIDLYNQGAAGNVPPAVDQPGS